MSDAEDKKPSDSGLQPFVLEVDGTNTLPIYTVNFELIEALKPMGSAKARVRFPDPTYAVPDHSNALQLLNNDNPAAIKFVEEWLAHYSKFRYFIQFLDDPSRERIVALSRHTELLTTLCDCKLAIDPTALWNAFDSLQLVEHVHTQYRADPDKVRRFDEYCQRLHDAELKHGEHMRPVMRLLQRIQTVIQHKAATWAELPPIQERINFRTQSLASSTASSDSKKAQMNSGPQPIDFRGMKTLPLHYLVGRLQQDLVAFGKASMKAEQQDPEYQIPDFSDEDGRLQKMDADSTYALRMVKSYTKHRGDFQYFIQFLDDPSRKRISALSGHTRLISKLCDVKLRIDTSILWKAFDALVSVDHVQTEYREDAEREVNYSLHCNKLEKVQRAFSEHLGDSIRLLQRIEEAIGVQAPVWNSLPKLFNKAVVSVSADQPLKLFYSYSHDDEELCKRLQTHLAAFKNDKLIDEWYDRKITGGQEWKGQIDENLNAAHIILLLISASFIASPYCHDIELKRAMERHELGQARVIPVILRPCHWTDCVFGKLQAFPKDGRAVTLWRQKDTAFTDIAKGLRAVIAELRNPVK